MPNQGQNFPYVLPIWERQTVVLAGIQITLLVRRASRVSNRSFCCLHPSAILSLFMRGGAPTAHDSLVANSVFTLGILRTLAYNELGF
jgi:hypothetical protein